MFRSLPLDIRHASQVRLFPRPQFTVVTRKLYRIMIGGKQARSVALSTVSLNCTRPFTSQSGKIVILEGNIGAGKTTLACQVARQLRFRLFLEPTTKNPYLAKFYEDPNKYALKLQLWIFKQRFRTFVEAAKHFLETGQGVLLDRSVFSDTVFADANYQQGTISSEGYRYYSDLNEQVLKAVPVPHVTLFLDASPHECHERIHGRGRDFESGIPLQYLQSLDAAYREFLVNMREIGSNVIVYDWSDFGYKHEVAKDVRTAATLTWDQDVVKKFKTMINNSSLVDQTLTLSYTIPEVSISEDENEGDDLPDKENQQHRDSPKKPHCKPRHVAKCQESISTHRGMTNQGTLDKY